MFSFLKQRQKNTAFNHPLLDDQELLTLRTLAEQLDKATSTQQNLDSRLFGNLPAEALGSGIDYAESRVYQAGDDPRSINWRLSARSQETFVKNFHIESRPGLCLLLDKRRSMLFGTRKRLKIAQAVRASCLLAFAAAFHQLPFQGWILNQDGLDYFSDTDEFLLNANLPCSSNELDHITTSPGLDSVFQEMEQRIAKGSLLFLISDFAKIKHQADLAQLHEKAFIQAILIVDKAELSLPQIGRIRLQALEQSGNYPLDSNRQKERVEFEQHAKKIITQRKSIITDMGISYCQLLTDEESIQNMVSLPLGIS